MNLSVEMRLMNFESDIQWNKSERKNKQISYANATVWNLEKWCWWTYLQGISRDKDVEDNLVDTVGEGEGEMNWGSTIDMYTPPSVKQVMGSCSVTLWQSRGIRWGGEREAQEGENIYTHGWFVVWYSKNQHSIIKQLSSN